MIYRDFLKSKARTYPASGFEPDRLNQHMRDFQRDITTWALRKGKAAILSDTGSGKSLMQLSFADAVHRHTGGDVLIVAPLAVGKQTARIEAPKFGLKAKYCRAPDDIEPGITIINYEMLSRFNASRFVGVVLDESSILKSYSGKVRNQLIDAFRNTPYRLACTATPAPNDFEELGNHAEFLGVMSRQEMLATYFVHDGGSTQNWRLKGHAQDDFWRWVASWAAMMQNPSDLGYDGTEWTLPPLNIETRLVESPVPELCLFPGAALSLSERREARKESLGSRVAAAAEIACNAESCLVWCDYNDESVALSKSILGAVEVKGADSTEHKENAMLGFAAGEIKRLVTKPSICGFGMNWQACSDMVFCGLSDSYEQFYQAIRRCYRFGQKKPVNVTVVISEREIPVLENIRRKEADARKMSAAMIRHTAEILRGEIHKTHREVITYQPEVKMQTPLWLGKARA